MCTSQTRQKKKKKKDKSNETKSILHALKMLVLLKQQIIESYEYEKNNTLND